MITESLLSRSIIALVALGLAITAFVMIHAALVAAQTRRLAEPLTHARLVLATALSSNQLPTDDDMRILASLPRGRVVTLVRELTRLLRDDGDSTIRTISEDLGIVDRAARSTESRLWWRRLAAARVLTLVDDARHLRPGLLQDRHPLVRAQAAEWTLQGAQDSEISALLGLLNDGNGLTRYSAKDALIGLGLETASAVAIELETAAGAAAIPLLEVATAIDDPRLLPGTLRLCGDDEPQVRALAADVLGTLGGSEALDHLHALLDDPDERVRGAAARSLGRLRHWPLGSEIAQRLEDTSWDVRHEAGLALRSIGAPGVLLLRRACHSPDPFAADMARQALDRRDLDEAVRQ